MGIYDRGWWREHHDKKAEPRSSSRSGGSRSTNLPREMAGWPRALLVLSLLVGASYLLYQYSTPPHRSGGALPRAASALGAVAMPCADPFPARGAMVSKNGGAWKNAAHRAETLFDNQTPSNVVVMMRLNGTPFASVAVPAASQTWLSVPMGSFQWQMSTERGRTTHRGRTWQGDTSSRRYGTVSPCGSSSARRAMRKG